MQGTTYQRMFLLISCATIASMSSIHERTTQKYKKDRTTASKLELATASPRSLLDMPQNDIYNNRVEDDIGLLPVTNPFSRADKSRISWETLQQNNDKKAQKKYIRMSNDKIIMRGATGPRGPPGAEMTKEDITKEFKSMVKSAANKRARKIVKAQCPSCELGDMDEDVLSFFYPGVDDKVKTVNRAPAAFTTSLLDKVNIKPEKTVQLKRFQLTGSEFGLLRGVKADLGMNGRFKVDRNGIYQFTTTLNFHSKHKVSTTLKSNYVQVLICPNGQCVTSENVMNPSTTQYIHSMDSRQRFFTIQLTAVLELKKSDYVSIYVRNSCRRAIDVQPGSLLTGIMLSV
ncbi:adipolin-like [Watersipora subatra]|uniref:adipolin-like n=1 Tax=Watersipora subatra TaxID=2589382 RepID=UPI00355BD5BB